MSSDISIQLVGIVLASAIPIIVLIFTLRSNRKAQEKSNNMQNSLLAKENINKEIDRTRNAVTTAYNQMDEFLFITSTMKPRRGEMQRYIDKTERIFVLFRQSINGLRFNTEIYRRQGLCEGCALCDVKLYGDLSKATSKLQEVIIGIDREVSGAFYYLQEALEGAATSHDLIKLQNTTAELDRSYISKLDTLDELRSRASHDGESRMLDAEIASITARKTENEIEFKKAENDLTALMDKIGELNTKGREKINDVIIKNKPQLDIAISEYFDIFREYARQYSNFILENGKPSNRCKKTTTS